MGIRQNIRLVVRRHEILYGWHILLINGYEWIAHKHFKYRARLKVCPKFCDIAPRGQAQTTFETEDDYNVKRQNVVTKGIL